MCIVLHAAKVGGPKYIYYLNLCSSSFFEGKGWDFFLIFTVWVTGSATPIQFLIRH